MTVFRDNAGCGSTVVFLVGCGFTAGGLLALFSAPVVGTGLIAFGGICIVSPLLRQVTIQQSQAAQLFHELLDEQNRRLVTIEDYLRRIAESRDA